MRFTSYLAEGRRGLALDTGEGLRGLAEGDAGFPGTLDDLVGTEGFADAARALAGAPLLDPEGLVFDLPFRRSEKLLCIGLNYADHAAETRIATAAHPVVFVRFLSELSAHGEALVRPHLSEQFDYEGELVAVIGRGGRAIPKERALEHVAGYTIFNDGSIRDLQMRVSQWTLGKNVDRTGALGPAFVTADALPPGAAGLRLETRVNGEVLQQGDTSDMIFGVADLVAEISEAMTLRPGDMIATGTPAGVGFTREPPVFLRPGDLCESEIEGIGTLRNPVVAEG